MRPEVKIIFWGHRIPGGAQTILGPANCGPDVAVVLDLPEIRSVDVVVRLLDTDERLPKLLGLLQRYGAGWTEIRSDKYSDEELAQSRLLIMQLNRECEVDGGVEFGTTFDLSQGCPACGTGAPQTSALFIDGEHISRLEGHRAAETYHWHTLVDERLAADLEKTGATGLLLRSVYAIMPDKRQVKLRWKQLCAENTLPPVLRKTGFLVERQCTVCRRNGNGRMQEEFNRVYYRSSDLTGMQDVNYAWEWFGFAVLEPDLRDSLLSHPWTLVTPKVWRVFRDAGVTEIDFLPIHAADE